MTESKQAELLPEQIWLAKHLAEQFGVETFLVPPNLRHLCVEYVRADTRTPAPAQPRCPTCKSDDKEIRLLGCEGEFGLLHDECGTSTCPDAWHSPPAQPSTPTIYDSHAEPELQGRQEGEYRVYDLAQPDERRLSEIRKSLACEYNDLKGLKFKFGAALMDLGVLLSLLDSQQRGLLLTETEAKLLIDWHEQQATMGEPMGYDVSYHDQRIEQIKKGHSNDS